MSKIHFTADLHLGHARIIEFSNRPFGSVEEMDEVLIENWNKTVRPNDVVWLVGDFCYWKANPREYWDRLNGQKHLIWGNHDEDHKPVLAELARWSGDVRRVKACGEAFWLSHYPHRAWRNSHHGVYHLYGHTHGDFAPYRRSMDVGVDAIGYKPISAEEVIELLKDEPPTPHHQEFQVEGLKEWNDEY